MTECRKGRYTKRKAKEGKKAVRTLLRDAERRAELDGETELISSEALYSNARATHKNRSIKRNKGR